MANTTNTEMKDQPSLQMDETLDLFNLLDYLLLKTNFKISKGTQDPDQLKILNNAFYRVLGELKNQSFYTALSSLPRLVIVKSKKEDIEKYLEAQKVKIQKELNATDKEFKSLATFSWTWVWFTFQKLTSQEIINRYNTLMVTRITAMLEGLLKATKESSTEAYKLKAKEEKLLLFTEFASTIKSLRGDNTDLSALTKILLEVKQSITDNDALGNISSTLTSLEQALKNDIVKVRKAPRKVILC